MALFRRDPEAAFKRRDAKAKDPSTGPDELLRLAQDPNDYRSVYNTSDYTSKSEGSSYRIACRRDAPVDALRLLLTSNHEEVRSAVAANPNLPQFLLEELAGSDERWIREAVAGNPSTPPDTLKRLSRGEHEQAVSRNPSTPPDVLLDIVRRGLPKNGWGILVNPAATAEVLEVVASSPNCKDWMLEQIVVHPSASPELLQRISATASEDLMLRILEKPDVPRSVVRAVLNDEYASPRLLKAAKARSVT